MKRAPALLLFMCALLALAGGCAPPTDEEADEAEASEDAIKLEKGFLSGYERAHVTGKTTLERQRSAVHFGNAFVLARLSALAYEDEAAFRAGLPKLGLGGATVHTFANRCTGATAYHVASNFLSIVVFRGTEPASWLDLKTDLDVSFAPFRGRGVHRGFFIQFASIWSPDPKCGVREGLSMNLLMTRGMEEIRPTNANIYFTGHSLGGALATLALAASQGFAYKVTSLYTFGSPKVGDEMFGYNLAEGAAAAGTTLFRFVNHGDIVTGVPQYSQTVLYRHASPRGGDEAAFQVWLGRNTVSIGEAVLSPLVNLMDHPVAGYAAAIMREARARGQL